MTNSPIAAGDTEVLFTKEPPHVPSLDPFVKTGCVFYGMRSGA